MNWAEVLWLGLCAGVVVSTIFYAYRRGHSDGWVFGFSDGYMEAIEYRRHATGPIVDLDEDLDE